MYGITVLGAGKDVYEIKNLSFTGRIDKHIFLCFKGPVVIEGESHSHGACFLYKEGSVQNYTAQEGFCNSYVRFRAPDELFAKLKIKTNHIFYPENFAELDALLAEMTDEYSRREPFFGECLAGLTVKLLVLISRNFAAQQGSLANSEALQKITEIRAQYLADPSNPPDISALIAKAGMSRSKFYSLYSLYFRSSPKEELLSERFDALRALIIENPDVKISSAAESCGFNDMPYFFRAFKRRYGYTPSEFMRAAKENKG